MTMMNAAVEEAQIEAELLVGTSRVSFLPQLFCGGVVRFIEPLTLFWMQALAQDYNGSEWNYYKLSNGGFYMAPDKHTSLSLQVHGNYFGGTMSADAAGIVATLFALGELAARTEIGRLSDLYHLLRAYACQHPERGQILAAID
ncbi:antirestriction protein [Pseudomonas sp. PDM20]|uniref:antirestriction protein n=1 Tax=Pseudomonas sp. PDM20 TaxID=2769254 RepID=UPI001CE04721|nr:antirestriction protein [Pseudomonas sp. PDM20]